VFAAADDSYWYWLAFGLPAVPVLIAVNAFFVAAEFALIAVRKTRVEEMVAQGVKGSKAVAAALERLDRSIAATQLGITLASIGLGFVGEPALAALLDPLFQNLFGAWHGVASHSAAVALAFLLVTFLHVVFGELVPKSMALQEADDAALWLAKPLNVFARLSRPLLLLMGATSNAVLRLLGFRPAANEEDVHSIEELLLVIQDTEEAGVLDADQADLVENVFRMAGKQVVQCMTPRDKVAALELSMPPDNVLEAVRAGAHTRMPVYEGTLDNIVGIVNTKDLFYLFSLKGVVVLQDALYPALFLKPDEELDDALRLFRRAKRPMALVRDEEGKILGLITLEDVVEEIVGDIEDEHDRPTARLRRFARRKLLRPKLTAGRKGPGDKRA
jgi:CBS domain containing-hemolysin-like protein